MWVRFLKVYTVYTILYHCLPTYPVHSFAETASQNLCLWPQNLRIRDNFPDAGLVYGEGVVRGATGHSTSEVPGLKQRRDVGPIFFQCMAKVS